MGKKKNIKKPLNPDPVTTVAQVSDNLKGKKDDKFYIAASQWYKLATRAAFHKTTSHPIEKYYEYFNVFHERDCWPEDFKTKKNFLKAYNNYGTQLFGERFTPKSLEIQGIYPEIQSRKVCCLGCSKSCSLTVQTLANRENERCKS